MIGLEFICKVFDIQYKEVAGKIGVSNQTITDWIKGKTSKIPDKRLYDLVTNIPEFSNINKDLFSKELTPSDKQRITTNYLVQDIKKTLYNKSSNNTNLKEALVLNELAKSGSITNMNISAVSIIIDNFLENEEFMRELADLIIKYGSLIKD